jgi:hypothetical protein
MKLELTREFAERNRDEIYRTEIKEHSGLKYHIEMRDHEGVWQQRHVWYPAPATFVNEITTEKWIRSVGGPSPNMKLATDR